jgi:hypothetical protein
MAQEVATWVTWLKRKIFEKIKTKNKNKKQNKQNQNKQNQNKQKCVNTSELLLDLLNTSRKVLGDLCDSC